MAPKLERGGEIGPQLSQAEIRALVIPSKTRGVMGNQVPFTLEFTSDFKTIFRMAGAEYPKVNWFDGDKYCNDYGCAKYYRLTEAGVKKWRQTHLIEQSGAHYYFTVIEKTEP